VVCPLLDQCVGKKPNLLFEPGPLIWGWNDDKTEVSQSRCSCSRLGGASAIPGGIRLR